MDQHDNGEPKNLPNRRRRFIVGGVAAGVFIISAVGVTGALQDDGDQGVMTDAERAAMSNSLMSELASASPGQQEALADGNIEKDEIMALAEEASKCSVAQGTPPIEVGWGGTGPTRSYQFDPDLPIEEVERLLALSDACWDEHVGIVESLNAIDAVPSVDEQRAYNQAVQQCLIAQDEPGDNWPATDADIDPSIEARCVDEVEAAP